jgi:calcineurin-like phosphoesterase
MFIGQVAGDITSTINHPDYDNRRPNEFVRQTDKIVRPTNTPEYILVRSSQR